MTQTIIGTSQNICRRMLSIVSETELKNLFIYKQITTTTSTILVMTKRRRSVTTIVSHLYTLLQIKSRCVSTNIDIESIVSRRFLYTLKNGTYFRATTTNDNTFHWDQFNSYTFDWSFLVDGRHVIATNNKVPANQSFIQF